MLLALGRAVPPAGPLPGPIRNVRLPLPLCAVLRGSSRLSGAVRATQVRQWPLF